MTAKFAYHAFEISYAQITMFFKLASAVKHNFLFCIIFIKKFLFKKKKKFIVLHNFLA